MHTILQSPLRPARPCPLQSFLRMKADAAWQQLEGKVAGTDVEYKDVKVTPLLAVLPAPEGCPPGVEPGCMLPAEVRRVRSGGGVHRAGNWGGGAVGQPPWVW